MTALHKHASFMYVVRQSHQNRRDGVTPARPHLAHGPMPSAGRDIAGSGPTEARESVPPVLLISHGPINRPIQERTREYVSNP